MRLGCCAYSYRDLLKSGEMSLEDFVKTCEDLDLDGVQAAHRVGQHGVGGDAGAVADDARTREARLYHSS